MSEFVVENVPPVIVQLTVAVAGVQMSVELKFCKVIIGFVGILQVSTTAKLLPLSALIRAGYVLMARILYFVPKYVVSGKVNAIFWKEALVKRVIESGFIKLPEESES